MAAAALGSEILVLSNSLRVVAVSGSSAEEGLGRSAGEALLAISGVDALSVIWASFGAAGLSLCAQRV